MIVKEFYRMRQDGVNLYRTYSTDGSKIRKVGTDEIYDEAIDVENSSFNYEETSEHDEFTNEEFRQMVEEAMR